MIEKKVAYEELNLLPIWLNKKSLKKISHASYNIGLYFFKELNISIIVPELDNLTTDEKELFKNLIYQNYNYKLNEVDSFCIDSRLVQKNDIFLPFL